jgi:serine/threonine protein kinase
MDQQIDEAAEVFRNNQQLQQFVLPGVTPTGRVLGAGSYGTVEEVGLTGQGELVCVNMNCDVQVVYNHHLCVAKKLHETLIVGESAAEVIGKYQQECQFMSSLQHPNITQFLGICFLPETQLPLLVMERLETSLDDLLEHIPSLPLSLKRSVLEDVASGLLYLHDRPSPVIHRDLTAKNVLLTSSLVAKITDMGNSCIIDMRPGQMARTFSKLPGTLAYMPPEALDDRNCYGPALDIFSFGHLALFTLIQV